MTVVIFGDRVLPAASLAHSAAIMELEKRFIKRESANVSVYDLDKDNNY